MKNCRALARCVTDWRLQMSPDGLPGSDRGGPGSAWEIGRPIDVPSREAGDAHRRSAGPGSGRAGGRRARSAPRSRPFGVLVHVILRVLGKVARRSPLMVISSSGSHALRGSPWCPSDDDAARRAGAERPAREAFVVDHHDAAVAVAAAACRCPSQTFTPTAPCASASSSCAQRARGATRRCLAAAASNVAANATRAGYTRSQRDRAATLVVQRFESRSN